MFSFFKLEQLSRVVGSPEHIISMLSTKKFMVKVALNKSLKEWAPAYLYLTVDVGWYCRWRRTVLSAITCWSPDCRMTVLLNRWSALSNVSRASSLIAATRSGCTSIALMKSSSSSSSRNRTWSGRRPI